MILDAIRQHYSKAVTGNDFVRFVYDRLCCDYLIAPSDIMLAHSVCGDDVININYAEENRQLLGPFNLGGLGGFPFTGLTGMSAFSKHVPDSGAALVLYGPHIGVGAGGETGKIMRVGHTSRSACCGAASAALLRLEQNQIFTGETAKDEIDLQQQTLEEIVFRNRDRILSAENRLQAVTEVILDATEQRINELINRTRFTGKYVFVVGAIIINGEYEDNSFLELRRFDCLDADTKQIVAQHHR